MSGWGPLTGLDSEAEGVLLLDGVCEVEASVAAVVSLCILEVNIGEVQVSVLTHGHPFILRDWIHIWWMQSGDREENILFAHSRNQQGSHQSLVRGVY